MGRPQEPDPAYARGLQSWRFHQGPPARSRIRRAVKISTIRDDAIGSSRWRPSSAAEAKTWRAAKRSAMWRANTAANDSRSGTAAPARPHVPDTSVQGRLGWRTRASTAPAAGGPGSCRRAISRPAESRLKLWGQRRPQAGRIPIGWMIFSLPSRSPICSSGLTLHPGDTDSWTGKPAASAPGRGEFLKAGGRGEDLDRSGREPDQQDGRARSPEWSACVIRTGPAIAQAAKIGEPLQLRPRIALCRAEGAY